jgi:hypothetical protein
MFNFISGEKFKALADFEYIPNQPIPNQNGILYCKTDHLSQCIPLIEQSKNKFILISHNSDGGLYKNPTRPYDYKYTTFPKNVQFWFAQNVVDVYKYHKLIPIPIGVENSEWFPYLQKRMWLNEFIDNPPTKSKLFLINHNPDTNPSERLPLYQMFQTNDWCSVVYGMNGSDFLGFRNQIASHKYIACPDGNGLDTHRIWEALYLRTIPIVKSRIAYEYFREFLGLPILIVDDWKEITKERLESEFDLQFYEINWTRVFYKLNFDYYTKLITFYKEIYL